MKKSFSSAFEIDGHLIGHETPVYFVADIAANHDGDLNRAIDLIYLAAESGADAAKFQHFRAETIVSDYGFRSLGSQQSHQSKWKTSVFDVYKKATVNLEWTEILQENCKKAGITFFTSPYDMQLLDEIDRYVPAYKIGSGDITWIEMIESIASKGKPYILASGASTLDDVIRAVSAAVKINDKICLMQCNTNYTADIQNLKFVQLNVLNTYKSMFPKILLGLSDHTPGHASVLGAITLGARIIEKHFTDNKMREGPDHLFSMDPKSWKEMVDRSRELEAALGHGLKQVEENELETIVLQRRSVRAKKKIVTGSTLTAQNLIMLRPCPHDSIPPYKINQLIGKKVRHDVEEGDYLKWTDLE
jgi:sialic acid synthase SpsE